MKFVTYILLYPVILVISHLPFRVLYFFSDITFCIFSNTGKNEVVRFNLETSKVSSSKKDLIRIEQEFYRHLTDVFFEMFKFYGISKEEIKKRFYLENSHLIENLAKNKKNVSDVNS